MTHVKSQIPSSKSQPLPMPNFQSQLPSPTPNSKFEGSWDLGVGSGWSLELGIWLKASDVVLHLERLWQDVRHGARVFARNRALTAIAVLSIACGTGANVAMFSVADAMLLRPLPVSRPGELLALGFKSETATRLEQGHASVPRLSGSPRACPQLRRDPRLRLRNRWDDAPSRRSASRPDRLLRQRQLLQRARGAAAARPRIPRGRSRRRDPGRVSSS